LKVEANQRGYLYLIARGSSGIWKPLFPSREASDNVVEARGGYDMPSSAGVHLDDQEGGEAFLLFSGAHLRLDCRSTTHKRPGRARRGQPQGAQPVVLAQNLNDRRVDNTRCAAGT
jgi:hypothetical protein